MMPKYDCNKIITYKNNLKNIVIDLDEIMIIVIDLIVSHQSGSMRPTQKHILLDTVNNMKFKLRYHCDII